MNVGFDTYFEDGATGVSPLNITSGSANDPGSISSSNPNRALFVAVVTRTDAVGTITVTWDGVAMDPIGVANPGGSLGFIRFFWLKNPATGSKVLSVAWTGGSDTVTAHAWSLYNVDQATGWQNFTTNTNTSTGLSTGAVTTTGGNMVLAAAFDNDATSGTFSSGSSGFTSDIRDGRFSGNYHGAHQPSNGGSETLSGTLGSSVLWVTAAVDVIAAVAVNATVTQTQPELRPFPYAPSSPRGRM